MFGSLTYAELQVLGFSLGIISKLQANVTKYKVHLAGSFEFKHHIEQNILSPLLNFHSSSDQINSPHPIYPLMLSPQWVSGAMPANIDEVVF